MLAQGGQGTTCRSLLSPSMTWVPSTKFRVSGWHKHPYLLSQLVNLTCRILKIFITAMNISPESKIEFKYRITVYAYIPITWVWSLYMIKQQTKKQNKIRLKKKEGKEKINSMKTSTIFLLTKSKVLFQRTRVQVNLQISRVDKYFSFTLIGRTTTQLFPLYQSKLREDWNPARKGFPLSLLSMVSCYTSPQELLGYLIPP